MIKAFRDAFGQKFGQTARVGLLVGGVGIIAATALLAYWLLRTEYQVLFADLTPQDTAAMTAELERQKTPFILNDQGNGGTTILVDKGDVYKTRIKLMGKDIPLNGAIGFELFNNSDFGMTEFAQKVNYQRALQGELTRTILSLAEIRDVRVLLALPEQGLFKQVGTKPKASVAVTMEPGQHLRGEQVVGIQRLVAAAVPGILAQDVTLVDQSGVALTRAGSDGTTEVASGVGSLRLDLKKEAENYLANKATLVLDRALGPGQALASVDVTLDLDRVQSNTDEIIGIPGKPDEPPTGVVVRHRQTIRESPAPLNAQNIDGTSDSPGGSQQSELEYVVGHRIEQIIRNPGSIQRIKVAVVTQKPLNPDQQEQLRKMVAASIGASFERGDEVVVQTTQALAQIHKPESSLSPRDKVVETPIPEGGKEPISSQLRHSSHLRSTFMPEFISTRGVLPFAGLICVAVCAWLLMKIATRYRVKPKVAAGLTESERKTALAQIQAWLHLEPTGPEQSSPKPSSGSISPKSSNESIPAPGGVSR